MYDKEKLRDILINEEYRTVDNEGKVHPPSHAVYGLISETLACSKSYINPKHIYTILKNDRSDMYSAVLKAFSIKSHSICNDSKDSSYNTTVLSNTYDSIKKFKLVISEEKWAQMKPNSQSYGHKGRRYMTLQPGKWTHIFAEKIWEQTKLPCAFTFKRVKVFTNSDAKCYTKFKGKCKECNAQLIGILRTKPAKASDIIFNCSLSGFSTEIIHKKKRQLKGSLRNKVAAHLLDANKDAEVWRNEEANRLMTFGDNIPPILYDATVLRKAKQTESDKRLQLQSTDPIRNIQNAKYIKFPRTIHNVGLEPFYCMYWSQEQQITYKQAHKEDANCFLTIDATGGIGKKIRLPNGQKSAHLFLYECVCVSNLCNFPAFQMISAKQDASIISYFFSEIIRDGAPIPRIVITDFGKAILVAVARIFSGCINLSHYMQICYNILNSDSPDTIPLCFIRLDVNHFITMIARWECLKSKTVKIKQFFLRCLGRVYQMDNFNEVRDLMKSILVVALSEEIGSNENDTLLQSQVHLTCVNNIIKGMVIDEIEEQEEQENECDDYDENIVEGWALWAESIFIQAQEIANNCCNGNIINAYYNVEAAKKIKRLMHYLPLWTNIMGPYFKRGSQISTSSFVESEFAQLKTRVFKNELPMRVDKFILRHLQYLDGKLMLTYSAFNKKTVEVTDSLQQDIIASRSIDTSDLQESAESAKCEFDLKVSLNEMENWRCKIKTETSTNDRFRKRPNYLTPCADWDCVDNTVSIPLLKNGNLCNATMVNRQKILVRETCAFDSIFQIIASGMATYNEYKNVMETHQTNSFIKLIGDILKRGKIGASDYCGRAIILCDIPIFSIKVCTRAISTLNTNCNAAHLAEYIFKNMPSYTNTYECPECGQSYNKTSPIYNININEILQNGLTNIQYAINDNIITKQITVCNRCQGAVERNIIYGSHLILDTTSLTDYRYINSIGIEPSKYILQDIPINIIAGGHRYDFIGTVSYIHSKIGSSHYIAYTRTGNYWYKYDDLAPKRYTSTPNEEIKPHVLFSIKRNL